MFLYNTGIRLYGLAVRMASPVSRKAKEWVKGRKGWRDSIRGLFSEGDRVIWVHCASLGEFEQGRPVIERIRKEHPEYKILLTFFSPSGYRIRKDYGNADAVMYLPADTPSNVRFFLDAVKPETAIFVKYEFWLNYLRELGSRDIRTYIVSAIFRADSVFFRSYGGIFRRGLGAFTTIFVQNEGSAKLLRGIGVSNVTVSGDTRFDRVASISDTAKDIPAAEKFSHGSEVLVAGSTWPEDEELLTVFMTAHPHLKYIIVPHEIDRDRIDKFVAESPLRAVKLSEWEASPDGEDFRVLLVDSVGLLSSLYRYGKYSYIGGGFGIGIHNTLEAATFGLPVAFGPNYGKFREARELVNLGCAAPVKTAAELSDWYDRLSANPRVYAEAKARALSYVAANRGATDTIMSVIFGD